MPSEERASGQLMAQSSDVTAEEQIQSKEGTENMSDNTALGTPHQVDDRPRKPAGGVEKREREEMEKLLGELCGHLGLLHHKRGWQLLTPPISVLYSKRFLEAEDVANNFLFNADRYDYHLRPAQFITNQAFCRRLLPMRESSPIVPLHASAVCTDLPLLSAIYD